MYPIELRLASKNGFHTPAEAKAYYGRYSRSGITWHWWNSPDKVADSDHDNIVNYILGKAARGVGSVNYVLSNTKITLVVGPDNVAWASQKGNPTTVSVELSPHLDTEGYKKAGWLANELFNPSNGRYKIPLRSWRHSDWFSTACPGTIDVNRINAEANKWATGGYDPKPTPPPVTEPIIAEWTLWKENEQRYVANKQPTKLYDVSKAVKWSEVKTVKDFNKDDQLVIAASFKNVPLNTIYYTTRYSFDRKIANGFNPADLDIYAPPTPEPTPPPEPPDAPVEPTDPDDTPIEYPGWFVGFWYKLWDAIKAIFSKGK